VGMYDQLLSVTQQGLDRNNQIAMASAQQPTMADVFMDRFRQGGQDRMAAQKMQSDMAMNEAYKQQQQENMKSQMQDRLMKRNEFGANYISENMRGDNRGSVEGFLRANNLENMVGAIPQAQYRNIPATATEMEPAAPGMSLAEGGEDTISRTPEQNIKIPGSDSGEKAWLKQQALDNAMQRAKIVEALKLAALKQSGDKNQSPIGKLLADYERSTGVHVEMTDDLLNAGLFKGTAVPNPLVPVAGQNGQIVQPFASPRRFVTPGTQPQPQQGNQAQPTPRMYPQGGTPSGSGQTTPGGQRIFRGDFVTPKAAAEEAAIKSEEEGKDLQLQVTSELFDRAINNPALRKGTFAGGRIWRDGVTDPQVKNLYDDLETLVNAETLQMIGNMKTRGGLVVRNLAEFKALGNSLRKLDAGSPQLEENLVRAKQHLEALRKIMSAGAMATREIKRPGSTAPQAGGEHSGKSLDGATFNSLSPEAQKLFTDGGGRVE